MNKLLSIIILVIGLFGSPVRIARDVHSRASGTNNARIIVEDSGGHLYCAYSGNDGGNYNIYIARSTDDGVTWESRWAAITSGSDDNYDPSLAIDSFDTLHVIWRGNISSGEADLLYTKYPSPSIMTVCTHSGYPGAYCPSLAVDNSGNLYAAWTGCPSSWEVRYAFFDRSLGTWGTIEDIGTRTPSRWPSIEIDIAGNPHIVYRNEYSGNYHAAHRYRSGGSWNGFNGADHDTLDEFVTGSSTVEFTSIFIDNSDNLYALWLWESSFSTTPDTLRFRKYRDLTSTWRPIQAIWGNTSSDARASFNGDVVADELGNVFVLYHDSQNIYCAISTDFGETFFRDTLLQDDSQAINPNARGSNFPPFNRPNRECIDYVWTWLDPDSAVNSLMFDRMCISEDIIDSTHVCAEFGEPGESTYTSCSDQAIYTYIHCCGGDTIHLLSDTNTVDYFDSTTMSWVTPVYPAASIWESFRRIDAEWIWFEYPASSYESRWFRSFMTACDEIDSAYIHVQCDNKAHIYANGSYIDTTHGNSGGGYDGWRTRYEFDLTPYLHGGVDTIEIIGENASGYAGLIFEIVTICRAECCGEIDESTIDYTLNGIPYSTSDPELNWVGDSVLIFEPIPSDTFENGDTITACLEYAADTCTGIFDSTLCRTFFVDLAPPAIWDFSPVPDSTGDTLLPEFSWAIYDSLSGLDISSIEFFVDSILETVSVIWEDSLWRFDYAPDSALERGDTLWLCITTTDTTSYCDDNILDTCWYYTTIACRMLDVWVDCPFPCGEFVSCEDQSMTFGITDTAGVGIDSSRAYFTIINHHSSGSVDSFGLELPSPYIDFRFGEDSLLVLRNSWLDGDSVTIILDSLFSEDGCKTLP